MRLLFLLLTLAMPVQLLAQSADTPPATDPLQVVATSNPDKTWRPSEAQMARARQDGMAYFAARDSGNYTAAYAMFSSSAKTVIPYADWRQGVEAFNRSSGGIASRSIRKITWYKDPQGQQGVMAALDFNTDSPNFALHCGYIIMEAQTDGSFQPIREEENQVDRATAAKIKPEDMQRIKAAFRC